MSQRTSVHVVALDPVSLAGVAGVLRFRPELDVELGARTEQQTPADVTVLVVDEVDEQALTKIKAARRSGSRRPGRSPTSAVSSIAPMGSTPSWFPRPSTRMRLRRTWR